MSLAVMRCARTFPSLESSSFRPTAAILDIFESADKVS